MGGLFGDGACIRALYAVFFAPEPEPPTNRSDRKSMRETRTIMPKETKIALILMSTELSTSSSTVAPALVAARVRWTPVKDATTSA